MGSDWLVLVLIVALTSFVLGVVGVDEAAILKSCWNAKYNSTPVTFQDWTSGQPARVYMVDAWWSPRDSGIPLTVFTMTTIDRLGMLEAQCRGYAGPLSAAVYIPLVLEDDPSLGSDFVSASTELNSSGAGGGGMGRRLLGDRRQLLLEGPSGDRVAAARAKLQDFFTTMEEAGAAAASSGSGGNSSSSCCCQLRLTLFAERLQDQELAVIMPTNVMRNAAMLGVTTPLSAMIDVDIGVSDNINRQVRNPTWIREVMAEVNGIQPGMCIAPAWEFVSHTSGSVEVEGVLGGDKQHVVSLFLQSSLQAFQVDLCPHCHGAFNHIEWASTNTSYVVPYKKGFEPWGILWRLFDPGYEERFRGWLYDKMMHVEALGRKHNFRLIVMPDLWMVHRPHKKVAIAQIHVGELSGVQHQHQQQQQANNKDVQALLKVVQLPNGTVSNPYKLYRLYVDALRESIRDSLIAQLPYEPQLNAQFLHCKSVLPWWRK